MKKVIALVAIVLAIAWCGVADAGIRYEEVAQRMRAMVNGTIPLQNAPAGDTSLVSILVESTVMLPGETRTVGVYVSNNVPIQLFCVPLIVRSVDPGAYITNLVGAYNPNSRLDGWMNGTHNDTVYFYPIINTYPTYVPGKPPYRWVYDRPMFANPPAPPDYVSPDGLLFARGALIANNALPPGSDGAPRNGEPLITITFTANMNPGRFEIDTCVAAPANTVMFLAPGVHKVPLAFTKGTYLIKPVSGSVVVTDTVVNDPPDDVVGTDMPEDTVVADTPVDTTVTDSPGATVTDDAPADTLPTTDTVIIANDPPLDSFPIFGMPDDADNSFDSRDESTVKTAAAAADCYPNPFNSSTTIRYSLDGSRRVAVVIYDLLGRTVATLVDQYQSPGDYLIPWDGRDMHGNAVPAGIYFYRIQKGDFKVMGKMVLLK